MTPGRLCLMGVRGEAEKGVDKLTKSMRGKRGERSGGGAVHNGGGVCDDAFAWSLRVAEWVLGLEDAVGRSCLYRRM